jgi:hypothetical protein
MSSKIDPTLARALDEAATNDPVQTVVALKTEVAGRTIDPAASEDMATALIEQVTKETGESPTRYNVFKNLSSVAIEAPPKFIRRLLEHDEVISAVANQQSGLTIDAPPPVSKRPRKSRT